MITDKDPLPIYGFILAGCLAFVILLNAVLGQFLAGWRRPKMGIATARRRGDTGLSGTTLNGDGDGDGHDTDAVKRNKVGAGAGATKARQALDNRKIPAGLPRSIPFNGSSRPVPEKVPRSGNLNHRHNRSRDDTFKPRTNQKFIFDDDPDDVDEKTATKNVPTTTINRNGNAAGVRGDGKSRYAVLQEWSF